MFHLVQNNHFPKMVILIQDVYLYTQIHSSFAQIYEHSNILIPDYMHPLMIVYTHCLRTQKYYGYWTFYFS